MAVKDTHKAFERLTDAGYSKEMASGGAGARRAKEQRAVAVKDTHKAFERLTDAGYSKEMAEALLETLGDSWDELVTKPYLERRLKGTG